jgi:3-phosphoshikimate 1-carboxyvinyltransferase
VESAAEAEGVRIRSVPRTADRFEHDFTHCPDLAQALAATCAGLGIKGRLTGLDSLRIKETDRLEALRHELSRTGTRTSIKGDSELFLYPAKAGYGGAPIRFATWDDHRMAMALAPLCLRLGELVITDPQVVIKSYPGFWDDLAMAGFKIIRS